MNAKYLLEFEIVDGIHKGKEKNWRRIWSLLKKNCNKIHINDNKSQIGKAVNASYNGSLLVSQW
jgi:hypothetical protein